MFKLTPEAQARVEYWRSYAEQRKWEFEQMNTGSLIASAKMYAAQCEPKRFAPGEPVYDATFYQIIVPELLRRLADADRA